MTEIGIGICTYNRLKALQHVVERVQATIDKSRDIRLLVSDDGSTDGTGDWLEAGVIPFIRGDNQGVVVNKNRLLKKLRGCDFIFIIEDDLEINKGGWIDFYIGAHQASGIHHFTFSPPGKFGVLLSEDRYGNYVIEHPSADGGIFSFYTKRVLEVCGGLCPKFKRFGWEHCEYSERIYRAGLTGNHRINNVRGSREYLQLMQIPSVIDSVERDRYRDGNTAVWKKSREEGWINCPL